jgi:hypothetical protein
MERCELVTSRPSGIVGAIGTLVEGIQYGTIWRVTLLWVLLPTSALATDREPPAHPPEPCASPVAAVAGSSLCETQDDWTFSQNGGRPSLGAQPQPPAMRGAVPFAGGRPQGGVSTAGKTTAAHGSPRGATGPTVRLPWRWSGAAFPQWLWTGWTYLQAGLRQDRSDRPTCTTACPSTAVL